MGANGRYWRMMALAPLEITEYHQYPISGDDVQWLTITNNNHWCLAISVVVHQYTFPWWVYNSEFPKFPDTMFGSKYLFLVSWRQCCSAALVSSEASKAVVVAPLVDVPNGHLYWICTTWRKFQNDIPFCLQLSVVSPPGKYIVTKKNGSTYSWCCTILNINLMVGHWAGRLSTGTLLECNLWYKKHMKQNSSAWKTTLPP